MCDYAIVKEGEMTICKYTKSFCTLCVLGNGNTYREAEAKKGGE